MQFFFQRKKRKGEGRGRREFCILNKVADDNNFVAQRELLNCMDVFHLSVALEIILREEIELSSGQSMKCQAISIFCPGDNG